MKQLRLKFPFHSALLAAAALVVSSGAARATWSVVAVDASTGEVAVGSVTCIEGGGLQAIVPVVLVGLGAGAAQSAPDATGRNRRIMYQGFRDGLTPREILQEIARRGSGSLTFQQYGIVGLVGEPLTFSGVSTGAASLGVVGTVEGIRYAIQGNVLAGDPVVFEAERAFRETDGDLSERLMAAMRGAAAFGGDGRCSCRNATPTGCGSPPPSFVKSGHIGFVVVARTGDEDGVCNRDFGCANGDYYLSIEVDGNRMVPDPVFLLGGLYQQWRAALAGRPDHILSKVRAETSVLPADGAARTRVVVELVDVDGVPLGGGGARVRVAPANPDAREYASPGPVRDLGDGSYEFFVTAGRVPGVQELGIHVDDGAGEVMLFPPLAVRVERAARAGPERRR